MLKTIFTISLCVLCLAALAAPQHPSSKKHHLQKAHKPILTLHEQFAAKDAVIADLRQQVQYLTGEIEALKSRLAAGGTSPGTSPAAGASFAPAVSARLSNDEKEEVLINNIAGERIINNRYVDIHGNPPDGDPNKRNPHMDKILAWDQELVDLLRQDVENASDPVIRSEKQRLLDEQLVKSGLINL